jgi:uncharacterized protein YndB with AHSA1/START domain
MSSHKSESIRVSRVLIGSPERIFDAWINPALLQRWLAPKAQVDAREGGHFRLEVPKPEGVHVVTGKYQEFKQNERLVMTWVYDGPMGNEGDMEALLRVEQRKHGSNTELKLQHGKLTNPPYRETIAKGAWTTGSRSTGNALGRIIEENCVEE